MRKIKKALALSLALAMGLSLCACGDKKKETTTTEPATEAGDDAATEADGDTEATVEQGKVLNVYVWNEEFKSRVTSYYPGYEEVDATNGKIGDVSVVWNITPSDDNAYQNNLDAKLLEQADAAADDKIDLFLVEADYALKYVDTEYAMPVADLGITADELSKQYKYTQDVMTDSNGVLKGVSWQGCPGVMFYNREIAKDVLGSDDPATVQEAVKDWDTYNATAATMKEKGYMMSSSVMDLYRVYSNNVSGKWVDADKNVVIDANIEAWAKNAKAMYDAGQATAGDLWGEEWSAGFYPDGKVFAYFGPMWEVNFSMAPEDEASVTYNGGWGACNGPQGFFWGGTWICAAAGTDNTEIVADIIRKLCVDDAIMKNIALDCDEFVNNQTVISEIAADTSIGAKSLGGQNPYQMLHDGAMKIDLSNLSAYDQGCNETFQACMKDYFLGNCTYEEAVASFNEKIVEKYPVLGQ